MEDLDTGPPDEGNGIGHTIAVMANIILNRKQELQAQAHLREISKHLDAEMEREIAQAKERMEREIAQAKERAKLSAASKSQDHPPPQQQAEVQEKEGEKSTKSKKRRKKKKNKKKVGENQDQASNPQDGQDSTQKPSDSTEDSENKDLTKLTKKLQILNLARQSKESQCGKLTEPCETMPCFESLDIEEKEDVFQDDPGEEKDPLELSSKEEAGTKEATCVKPSQVKSVGNGSVPTTTPLVGKHAEPTKKPEMKQDKEQGQESGEKSAEGSKDLDEKELQARKLEAVVLKSLKEGTAGLPGQLLTVSRLNPERTKRAKEQALLLLLAHSYMCEMQEFVAREKGKKWPCKRTCCARMKEVLVHARVCDAKRSCRVQHCDYIRRTTAHWKTCRNQTCFLCLTLVGANRSVRKDKAKMFEDAGLDITDGDLELARSLQKSRPAPQNVPVVEAPPAALLAAEKMSKGQTQMQLSDPLRQQLILLLHAHKCLQGQLLKKNTLPCEFQHCKPFKDVLIHMLSCKDGEECKVPNCKGAREITEHWNTCDGLIDCCFCLPVVVVENPDIINVF